MKAIYKFIEYQPHMVGAVAIAYLGGSIIAKTLCKESEAIAFNNFKCFNSADVCHAPGEVNIPLMYASPTTSPAVSGSTMMFYQPAWDSEEFTFPLV